MFSHIDLAGLESSKMFGYAKDLPFLKDRPTLDFKPGLNIVFGPNGSGKSTVLRMLAESMCAFQGGVPSDPHCVEQRRLARALCRSDGGKGRSRWAGGGVL